MSGDKIKRAARERQARTGEPYTLARRMVIEEHARLQAAQQTETEDDEPAVAVAEAPTLFLSSLLGPLEPYRAPEPSSGPPYTHVLRGPDPDDEEAMSQPYRPYSITKDGE